MIVVTPLEHLDAIAACHQPSHVLTLLSPGQEEGAWREPCFERQLQLYFHDIAEARAGLIAPDRARVGAILHFARTWTGARPLLVHCWAGISRSSAAAYMIACARNVGHERDIAEELRRRAPFATPNRLMVALADDLLQSEGRMIEAIERIGRGADAFQGNPYLLPASFPVHELQSATLETPS
jgi:predicted protein tyrosine phosphatase